MSPILTPPRAEISSPPIVSGISLDTEIEGICDGDAVRGILVRYSTVGEGEGV